jgi:predicted ester cyclase
MPGLAPGIHAIECVPAAWMAGTSPAMTVGRAKPGPGVYWSEPEDDGTFAAGPCGEIGVIAVIKTGLSDVYRDYIACLNQQDWQMLKQFVDDEAIHNGRRVGLSGYLTMLERDFDEIPDLYFNVQMLISDPPYIASRIGFDCTPKGKFLGLHVNGKRVSFTENVIYEFRGEKIVQVWSVIDKAAIEAQL